MFGRPLLQFFDLRSTRLGRKGTIPAGSQSEQQSTHHETVTIPPERERPRQQESNAGVEQVPLRFRSYRSKAQIVGILDLVITASHITSKIVSILIVGLSESLSMDVSTSASSFPMLLMIGVLMDFVGVYFACGLLSATSPQSDRREGMKKAMFWRCFQIFLIVILIISGTGSYRAHKPYWWGLQLAMFFVRLVFIAIVSKFITELEMEGALGPALERRDMNLSTFLTRIDRGAYAFPQEEVYTINKEKWIAKQHKKKSGDQSQATPVVEEPRGEVL